jgi:hypothetical protein
LVAEVLIGDLNNHVVNVTNSVGNPQSRVATLGKLAGVSTRLNLFEPLKWPVFKKGR